MTKLLLLPLLLIAVLTGCGATAGDAAGGNPTVGGISIDRDGKELSVDLQGHVTAVGPTIWFQRRRVVASPDGRWRAVVRRGPWGDEKTATVAIGPRGTNAPLRIVERHLAADRSRIAWSPDSRWLALTVFTGSTNSAVVVSTDGRRRVLARSFCGDMFSGFAWAPTGDRLAISEGRSGIGCAMADLDLSVRGADGSGGVIARRVRGVPSWSPDGHWLALSGTRTEVMRPDGSQRRRVGGSGAAAWSTRGTLLAFAGRYPDDALRVGSPGGALSTWERGVGEGPDPRFSPDGSLLAYQSGSDLVIRRVSNRSLVVRVHLDDFVFVDNLAWSSDGRSLLFDASSA